MDRVHWQQLSTWIKWHTKPPLYQFWKVKRMIDLANKTWISPLQKMAETFKDINLGSLEKINAYAKAPWNPPANVCISEKETAIAKAIQCGDPLVAFTDGSIKNNLAGIGVHWIGSVQAWGPTSKTISTPDHINAHAGELAATTQLLNRVRFGTDELHSVIFSDSQEALQSLKSPGQQSGQAYIPSITQNAQDINRSSKASV